MENRSSADDVDKDFKDSSHDDDERKSPAAAADRTDDLKESKIKEKDFAEEVPSELPSVAMASDPSDSHPNSSLQKTSASKADGRDCDVAHVGSVSGTKKLEHAPPIEQEPSTGLGMKHSSERPRVVYAGNNNVAPGAFPVVQSSHNTAATSQTFMSRTRRSYDSTRELTNEESMQGDGVPISAGASAGSNDSTREATESRLYTVEALLVPDGNDDKATIVAEAKSVTVKWYQRRWILACGLVGAVVVIVLLVVRPQSASSSSSLMSPTPAPTSLTPLGIACNFISIADVTECQSTFAFSDKTTGSTIPSEIGLLTQLTVLDLSDESLTSTIPSEIGLLTQLTELSFSKNELNSTIPSEIGLLAKLAVLIFNSNSLYSTIRSEIGLLTHLKWLDFSDNLLTSAIPSEIGLLKQLTHLDFSFNALTSTIPSEIGLVTQLDYLVFSINQLKSTIPSEMGLLAQLTRLDFSTNQLTSTIPSEIGRLTKLTYLTFLNNYLTGTIPSSLCSLPSPPAIDIDNGEIACASGCCY